MADKTRGIRVEAGSKRVRAYLSGDLVADTYHPVYVWEWPYYPAYYIPASDIRADLVPAGETEHSPSRGDAHIYHVKTAAASAERAALRYPDSPVEQLRDLVRLDWDSMTEWFEEEEPVYVHPRDPHKRVDILASSRRVRVEIDGETVAESGQPRILFETGLPPRYYLPLTDVRMDRLRPSGKQTRCPYKGTASYWNIDTGHGVHEDLVWIYRAPVPESQKIAGLACFYNEKVDIYLDGQLQPRPQTPFS